MQKSLDTRNHRKSQTLAWVSQNAMEEILKNTLHLPNTVHILMVFEYIAPSDRTHLSSIAHTIPKSSQIKIWIFSPREFCSH